MSISLKSFLLGHNSPKLYPLYGIFVIGLYAIAMIIAWTFFPGTYSMKYNDISDLGGWAENPNGFWWYNIPVVFIGLLLIPLMQFLYNGVNQINPNAIISKKYARMSTLISCCLFSLHGIFPQDVGMLHRQIAYFGFIGQIIGAGFYFYATFSHFQAHPSRIIKYIYIFINVWFFGVFFTMVGVLSISNYMGISIPSIYSPWEWLTMLSMLSWAIITTWLITNELINGEKQIQDSSNIECAIL